jgi:hypothetical protein
VAIKAHFGCLQQPEFAGSRRKRIAPPSAALGIGVVRPLGPTMSIVSAVGYAIARSQLPASSGLPGDYPVERVFPKPLPGVHDSSN